MEEAKNTEDMTSVVEVKDQLAQLKVRITKFLCEFLFC